MTNIFQEAIANRRSHYALKNESPITDEEIINRVRFAVKHIPAAFNSQSTRVVVLLHEKHQRLWQITKDTLQAIVPAEAFGKTKEKIERSFQSGYGTLLFYEDQRPVRKLMEQFPSTPTTSPHGRNTPMPCTSSRCGRCSRTPVSVRVCNIIIRSSTNGWQRNSTSPPTGR